MKPLFDHAVETKGRSLTSYPFMADVLVHLDLLLDYKLLPKDSARRAAVAMVQGLQLDVAKNAIIDGVFVRSPGEIMEHTRHFARAKLRNERRDCGARYAAWPGPGAKCAP